MRKFKIDDGVYWVETDEIKLLLPSPLFEHTRLVFCRMYLEYRKDRDGFTIVPGPPLNADDLTMSDAAMLAIYEQVHKNMLDISAKHLKAEEVKNFLI